MNGNAPQKLRKPKNPTPFGVGLQVMRKRLGLTQPKLAALVRNRPDAATSLRVTISQLENGHISPSFEVGWDLAQVLQTTQEEIVKTGKEIIEAENWEVIARPPPMKPDTETLPPEAEEVIREARDFLLARGQAGINALRNLLAAASDLCPIDIPQPVQTKDKKPESGRERNGNHLNLASENQQAHT